MPFTLLGLAVLCSGYPCGFVYQWVKMRHLIANAREFGLGVCLPKALILTGTAVHLTYQPELMLLLGILYFM